ncbi:MAG: ABC transporter permease [Oscillospiraceae bacterium]|nr:ABC transporter permease [Oscillospiraceae bacterium]
MKNDKVFEKKANQHKLKRHQEPSALGFGAGASAFLGAAVSLMAFDFKTGSISMIPAAVAGLFLIEALAALLALYLVDRQIIRSNEISRPVRLIGVLLFLTIANGNIFCSLAGLSLLKKDKNLEYQVGCYMLLVEILIVLVSLLNVFKPWVCNSFFLGLGVLGVVIAIHALSLPLVTAHVRGNRADKCMLPLAVVLIALTATGNLFSLLLGLILLHKVFTKDDYVSIGWIDVVKRLFRSQMAVLGAFIIVFLLSISICANLTFDYGIAVDNDYSLILQAPSLSYPFGTDDYGRCVFTRVIFGARISLAVGIISTAFSIVVGIILGAIAGFYSGSTDNIIMRILDIFMAIPGLLLPIAIIAAFGTNTANVIFALGVGAVPSYARTIRASVLQLQDAEFVEAARACGAKDNVIIFQHILPNSMAPLIIRATLGIGAGVTAVSSLSYLGLGIAPHIPEWGNILKAGSAYLESNPYMAIFPGFAIVLLVLAFNFLGDGLRDALDPKLK